MNKNKLNMKDFMNIGIFAALNFVLGIAVAFILGYVPITYMMIASVGAFVCGIPMMIFYARIKKFGLILLFGVIIGLIGLLMGRGYYAIILNVILSLIAECIMKSGKYQSSAKAIISYSIYSVSGIASYAPLYVSGSSYINIVKDGYGEAFAKTIVKFSAWYVILILIAATFICGLLGGLLGRKVFKKHFERSGVA